MTSEGPDKVDKQILKILEKDARLSYSEIGDKVGLSRVSVKNRITYLHISMRFFPRKREQTTYKLS